MLTKKTSSLTWK